MEMKDILELERRHREQMLEAKLKQARYENKQQAMNAGINIIAAQMRMNTMAIFALALRES